jgi:hypothetical protein
MSTNFITTEPLSEFAGTASTYLSKLIQRIGRFGLKNLKETDNLENRALDGRIHQRNLKETGWELRSALTVFFCVPYVSHNKQRLFP